MATINLRAAELSRDLFRLVQDFGLLSLAAQRLLTRSESELEDALDFAAAVAALQAAHTRLATSQLVIDTWRDDKDQSYARS